MTYVTSGDTTPTDAPETNRISGSDPHAGYAGRVNPGTATGVQA